MVRNRLLDSIGRADWVSAEEAALDLFHTGRFRDRHERNETAILLAQARVIGHLDPRGAFTILQSVVPAVAARELGVEWCARAHVVSAFVFGAAGTALHDPERIDLCLDSSRDLLSTIDDHDLRAMAAVARLGGGVGSPSRERIEKELTTVSVDLELAEAPVTRVLVAEVCAAVAGSSMRADEVPALERALALARSIRFDAAEARLLIDLAARENDRAEVLCTLARAALTRAQIDAPSLSARIDALEARAQRHSGTV